MCCTLHLARLSIQTSHISSAQLAPFTLLDTMALIPQMVLSLEVGAGLFIA